MTWVKRGRKVGWEDTDCLADDFMQSINGETPVPGPLDEWLLDVLAVRHRAAGIYEDMIRNTQTSKDKPLTLTEEREFRRIARRCALQNVFDQANALLGVRATIQFKDDTKKSK